MVAEGLGIAILPENSRQLTTNVDVRIVELVDPVISRNISILQYRQPMLSPAAAKMKEFHGSEPQARDLGTSPSSRQSGGRMSD